MNILLVSHEADMDGVTSMLLSELLAIYAYNNNANTTPLYVGYNDAVANMKEAVTKAHYDAVIVTDLSFTLDIHKECFPHIDPINFWFFDHHKTTEPTIFKWLEKGYPHINFDCKGEACAADLIYDNILRVLNPNRDGRDVANRTVPFHGIAVKYLVEQTHAGDLWLTNHVLFENSRKMSVVLAQLGPEVVGDLLWKQVELGDPREWANYDRGLVCKAAYDIGMRGLEASLKLANASKWAWDLGGTGAELVVCYAFGETSQVGNDLCLGKKAIVCMVDMKTGGLSFRSNKETVEALGGISCRSIAEEMGGGGHPHAAGAPFPENTYEGGLGYVTRMVEAAYHRCVEKQKVTV